MYYKDTDASKTPIVDTDTKSIENTTLIASGDDIQLQAEDIAWSAGKASLIDGAGKTVSIESYDEDNSSISTAGLKPGLYFLVLAKDADQRKTSKILIK